MAVIIDSLIIEVTRRCNMSCSHCLRGDAENVDMDIKYVDTLFSKIDQIYTLTFTGGEPSLVPDIIHQVLDSANRNDVEITNFYLVTNSKKITMEFIQVLLRIYQEYHNFYNEEDMPIIQWSNDIYHDEDEIDKEGLRLLKALKFASPRNKKNDAEYSLIDQGKASLYYACDRVVEPDEFEIEEDEYSITIREGSLYLDCNGYLIAGCDWSYENCDNEDHLSRICPVNEFSVEKIKEYQKLEVCV